VLDYYPFTLRKNNDFVNNKASIVKCERFPSIIERKLLLYQYAMQLQLANSALSSATHISQVLNFLLAFYISAKMFHFSSHNQSHIPYRLNAHPLKMCTYSPLHQNLHGQIDAQHTQPISRLTHSRSAELETPVNSIVRGQT
jgi:hypothetical protein